MRLPRIAEPLRHRDFRLLWIGQTITIFGTFVAQVAWPFQLIALGGSALELGTLASIFTASSLVFLLFGGALADRVPRRSLILVTELLSGVTTGIVAILGAAGVLQVWHLYVATAYFGAATAFAMPALGAIVPELVPEPILVPGNALRGLSRQFGRIGGPVLGGILVATAGPPTAFALDSLTFFASAIAVAFIAPRPLERTERRSILAEVREGLGFVFSVEWLWVTIFGFTVVSAMFMGAFSVGLPLLVTETLRTGSGTYGIVIAAMAVGEAVGAAVTGQVRLRRTGIAMYLLAALGGTAMLAYGAVPTVPGAVGASILLGLSFSSFDVLWQSALQRHVPRALLGRVTSVDWFGATLLGPIAPIGAAVVAHAYGPTAIFVVGGTVSAGLCLAALAIPSIRRLE